MMVGGEYLYIRSPKEQNSQVKGHQPDEPLERPYIGAEGAFFISILW